MAKEYTTKDILNSISWQLKRIADSLEKIEEQSNNASISNNTSTSNNASTDSTRLKDFLNRLGE